VRNAISTACVLQLRHDDDNGNDLWHKAAWLTSMAEMVLCMQACIWYQCILYVRTV